MRNMMLTAAMAALFCLFAWSAQAQATRTWVSGVGDDANPCSRTAPCKTFAGAISKTAVNGEINCLDPGGFGAVTITKAIIISCETGTAGVLVSGTNGIVVNVGGTSDVYLRGLDFEGITTGLSGILMIGGGALHIEKCIIRGFNAGAASGIFINPSLGAAVYVTDTVIADNGNGANGAGILVQPQSGGSANVLIDHVRAANNSNGIWVNNVTAGARPVNISISNTVATSNQNFGFAAVSGGLGAIMTIDRSVASFNGIGVRADGSTADVLIGGSMVSVNATGVSSNNSGVLESYKTNQINGNGSDGTPITGIALN
jgi:hypothetical protein